MWGGLLSPAVRQNEEAKYGRSMNILLIRSSALGDILCMYSAIVFLRSQYPTAKIDLMSRAQNSQVIEWMHEIDNHLVFNDKNVDGTVEKVTSGEHRKLKNLIKFIRDNSAKYDLIYVFQKSRKALALARLLRPKQALIGYKGGVIEEFLATDTVDIKSSEQEYIKHLKIVGATHSGFKKGLTPKASCISNDLQKIIESGEKLVVINAFDRGNQITKEGQIKDFVAEIFKCSSKVKIIFVGLAGKYDTVDRIRQDHPSSTLNLMGKTSLSDLFYILERADAVVTVDSGPMHIAAHVESKIYAVFGPTT